MSQIAVAACALFAAAGTLASARRAGRGFLTISSDMQPQVVAQTLVAVEDGWRAQAVAFAECNTTGAACDEAPKEFEKSCSTIVAAVMQASNGDRAVVQEYLSDVCGEPQLEGWRRQLCQEFSAAVAGAMTGDVYKNREELDAGGLCHAFWRGFADSERERAQRERAERTQQAEAAAKQRAEAEERAAAERAEAEKRAAAARARAEEEAAAEAAAGEQRRAAEERAAEAAEAGRRADAAAARAAEEAEREAAEVEQSVADARRTVEEAEGAEAERAPRGAAAAGPPDAEAAAPGDGAAAPANASAVKAAQ